MVIVIRVELGWWDGLYVSVINFEEVLEVGNKYIRWVVVLMDWRGGLWVIMLC